VNNKEAENFLKHSHLNNGNTVQLECKKQQWSQ
jgi:hypothetical protein